MKHGGKRPGSGRPKGSQATHTLQAQEFRKLLIERITQEAEPIIEALIKRAKSGDISAIKEAHERVLGKVKDNLDLAVKGSFSLTELLEEAERREESGASL